MLPYSTVRFSVKPDRPTRAFISAKVSDLSKLKEQISARRFDQEWGGI